MSISLPLIFQNNMVLQRRKPISVWGTAEDCASVTLELDGAKTICPVEDGCWKGYLPPMEAAVGLSLTISSEDHTVVISNVALGEVWIAGGQSNMEFLLKYDAEKETALTIEDTDIRCFEIPKISFPGQEKYYRMSDAGFWRKACPEESGGFSAVGFYFALALKEKLGVPIGIINCTWGGTSASCWVGEEYLTGDLQFYLDKAHEVQSGMDYGKELPNYIDIQKRILESGIDMGKPNLAPITPLIDEAMHERLMTMNNWPFSAFRPCGLYEFMLKTIVPFTVSGVIWYQGESDEYFSEHYESAMKAVIRCWRDQWKQTLPFIMVQLASFEVMAEYLDFVAIRKAQERIARTVEQTYMVTAMDVGMRYDIHPKRKRPIGTRLAWQALDKVYGWHICADSPTVDRVFFSGNNIVVSMKHTHGGLTVQGEKPKTFEVFLDGKKDENVLVQVSAGSITIQTDKAAQTARIAFCQKPWCELNVYSSQGLPVLPFDVTVTR